MDNLWISKYFTVFRDLLSYANVICDELSTTFYYFITNQKISILTNFENSISFVIFEGKI